MFYRRVVKRINPKRSHYKEKYFFYFENTLSQFPLQKHHEHTSNHHFPAGGCLYVKGILSQRVSVGGWRGYSWVAIGTGA